MQIREALRIAVKELQDLGITSANLDARLLMAKILEQSNEYVLANFNQPLNHDQQQYFLTLLNRRKSYEPVAYIIGEKEFYGRDFYVDNRVLIPRSDTEILVEGAIGYINRLPQNEEIRILDLGTGSGIIAVTLAAEMPGIRIVATDISEEIIELARENAIRHGVLSQIEFMVSNWYQDIPLSNHYEIIISNPPYIAAREKSYMARETLLHEPHEALFADNEGLGNYQKIIKGAGKYLSSGGSLFLEIGFRQFEGLSTIVKNNQLIIDEVLTDLQGHKRALRISNPKSIGMTS